MSNWSHREAAPGGRRLRLGLGGPSRSGKTYSSLRIADAIAKAVGKPIFFVDTDNEFALDYANDFQFQHVDFQPPFTSERYQDAIEYCVKNDPGVIVVDQMTHEHTGEGGMLERQEKLADELAAKWKVSREKSTWAAWSQAKAPHQKLVSYVTRVKQPMIFNFRAKDKIKLLKKPDGKQEVVHMGYTPICAEQFDYEMTAMLILPENSEGTPDKDLSEIRKPLRPVIQLGEQITEELGRRLAEWASGKQSTAPARAPQAAATSSPAAPAAGATISDAQESAIRDLLEAHDVELKAFLLKAQVSKVSDLRADRYDGAVKWIGGKK